MSLTTIVVLAHALIAIAFVAGLIGRWIVLASAARANSLRAIRTLLAASAPFERMVVVGSMLVLIFGLVAAFLEGRSVLGPLTGGSLDWLFVSLVLYLSVLPLVPLVFMPRGRVFGAALEDAERQGTLTPELATAFHDPVTRAAHVYELGAITVVLCLMLTKPF